MDIYDSIMVIQNHMECVRLTEQCVCALALDNSFDRQQNNNYLCQIIVMKKYLGYPESERILF